jgi:hypothetical protein
MASLGTTALAYSYNSWEGTQVKQLEVGMHGFPWLGGYSVYSYHSERAQVKGRVKQLEELV